MIKCNKCGKEFDMWDKRERFSINRSLGYGTKFDGSFLSIHLCCDCMEKIIDSCSINPIRDRPRVKTLKSYRREGSD